MAAAVILFMVWMLTTYLLEGRILTFQRPDAQTARLIYTLVANVLVGTVSVMVLIRYFLQSGQVSRPSFFGIVGAPRTLWSLLGAAVLGAVFMSIQPWPHQNPIVFLNAYAQVLVVTTAEVLVCWVLLGGALAQRATGPLGMAAALLLSAVAFGVYHYAHSPPFNTHRMVMFLTVVGLVTGVFYFTTRSVYATILFHNFMGTKGVADALARRDALESFSAPLLPLILTAAACLLLLVSLDLLLVRPVVHKPGNGIST
jgi:hypothetical protein